MPVIPHLLQLAARSSSIITEPLTDAKFELDSSGVAGFFGGESAVSGMATVNLIPNRRWGGWYNSPGSYEIAKQYGQLANSRFWDGLFPGGKHDPARLFELDGKLGPKFVAVHSGTTLASTGHLAHLIARMAREKARDETIPGRHSNSATVTVIDLPAEPEEIVQPTLPSRLAGSVFWAVIPIAVSWGCCILCALMDDWFSFAAILSGIIANGWACFVIGSGKLTFRHPERTMAVPAGDGFLFDNRNIVVLRGPEGAVNAVTQGRFLLQYRGQQGGESELKPAHGPPKSPDTSTEMEMEMLLGYIEKEEMKASPESDDGGGRGSEKKGKVGAKVSSEMANDSQLPGAWNALAKVIWGCIHDPLEILLSPTKRFIGFASFLLTVQFLAQLLLIPQGELLGQILFVVTLAFSWVYNSYLASLDRDDLQTTILFDILGLDEGGSIKKYQLGSWTATVVFTCLCLHPRHGATSAPHAPKILDEMIPNDTEVWKLWKRAVAGKITAKQPLQFTKQDWDHEHLNHDEKTLLRELLKNAMVVGRAWEEIRQSSHLFFDLSSINREDIQTELLRQILRLEDRSIRKFEFGTWTAMSTFACLALQGNPKHPLPNDASMVWDALLPSTTEVWAKWRTVVNSKLRLSTPWTFEEKDYEAGSEWGDQKLLKELLGDAQVAHRRYLKEYGTGPSGVTGRT